MQEIQDRAESLKDKNVLVLVNKCDLLKAEEQTEITRQLTTLPYPALFLSARNGDHLDTLRQRLLVMANIPENLEEDVIVSNQRHYEALCKALESISRIRQGMAANIPTDLLTEDLRDCIYHLNEIVGEVTSTDVLHHIFSHFCIGK